MDDITQQLKAYIETHPFDPGTSECQTVLEQLYQAYFESHESDPPEIKEVFTQLGDFLETLPIYIPGLFRTASNPSKTDILLSS